MIRKTYYLEASARTQDLLDVQQALQATGCAIGSTWHDQASKPDPLDSETWLAERFAELGRCDVLIVVCGSVVKTPLQVPLLAGHALGRGLEVIWIGSSVRVTEDYKNVTQFGTVEEFCETVVRKKRAA